MRAELVCGALEHAVTTRQTDGVVIHHSDQGSQYVSHDFDLACRRAGIERSMGSVGDCFDNAMAESFFATLEVELLDRVPLRNRSEARYEIHDWIEGFYNPRRRHSALGTLAPAESERRWRNTRS